MATGAEAIEAVAKGTGILPATIGRAARALREAGRDQWPQAAPGGGKNARHVQPHHLTNLALALAADPITSAPQLVAAMRDLVPDPGGYVGFDDHQIGPFLPGDTLGETLDGLVVALTNETQRDRRVISNLMVDIRRHGSRRPYVILTSVNMNDEQLMCHFEPRQHEMSDASSPQPDGAIQKSVELPIGLFRVLANLWADTFAQTQNELPISSSGLSPASNAPEDENAAPARAALSGDLPNDAARKRTHRKAREVRNPDSSVCVCISAIPESFDGSRVPETVTDRSRPCATVH